MPYTVKIPGPLRTTPGILFVLLSACVCISCGIFSSMGSSNLAPRSLNIQGNYDWIDGFGNSTACVVRIFWQGGAWRGWLRTDNASNEVCPWDDYDLPQLRMRGDRVRFSLSCPRSGCSVNSRSGTTYLLDVVPGVMLSGEASGVSMPPRWQKIRLVYKSGF